MRVYETVSDLAADVGAEIGVSGWVDVSQKVVDAFADATGDRQWIHVDPERAARGPYGATIAHGYLTLSLVPVLLMEVYTVTDVSSVINYGADGVRFPAPVRIPARLRGRVTLASVEPSGAGQRVVFAVTVEVEGESKPACVVRVTYLMIP
ncbi:MaoC family dehydratase [Frankia sp. AiPs1]|uniref:MaoC family dehydratase n=1 Tax=Frankia sp. AiPs1 TaxID=573493 RepID=UPI0020433BB8|nr:MaoC family dehydratase [Frankia sp. AiPs1]MCM3920503.1 MaoC family dehydratase [Frankia sp. AiPs1]